MVTLTATRALPSSGRLASLPDALPINTCTHTADGSGLARWASRHSATTTAANDPAAGRSSPGEAILYELAQVYGVSYRMLLVHAGHRVPEEDVPPDQRAIADLPLRAFAGLDAEDRQALIEYAAFLKQRKKGR
jgi:hypothetical protein